MQPSRRGGEYEGRLYRQCSAMWPDQYHQTGYTLTQPTECYWIDRLTQWVRLIWLVDSIEGPIECRLDRNMPISKALFPHSLSQEPASGLTVLSEPVRLPPDALKLKSMDRMESSLQVCLASPLAVYILVVCRIRKMYSKILKFTNSKISAGLWRFQRNALTFYTDAAFTNPSNLRPFIAQTNPFSCQIDLLLCENCSMFHQQFFK